MKITIEQDDGSMIGMAQEKGAEEFFRAVDLFKQAALAYGYHWKTVADYFCELDEERVEWDSSNSAPATRSE
jgi:hypothetical protein